MQKDVLCIRMRKAGPVLRNIRHFGGADNVIVQRKNRPKKPILEGSDFKVAQRKTGKTSVVGGFDFNLLTERSTSSFPISTDEHGVPCTI